MTKLLALSPRHQVSRKRSFDTWDRAFDRLLRIDQRTEAEIIAMIDWALGNEFWAPNIQSPGKLREKWDRLELERRRDTGKGGGPADAKRDSEAKHRQTQEWLEEQRAYRAQVEAERAEKDK